MLSTPKEFVLLLGGIAMLRALQQAFVTAFSTAFTLGANARTTRCGRAGRRRR
ncbi:hypothetical protein ACFWIX_00035 [Pseudarthrobacter sp. NPDC058362]|uniref:hypothetical protein n=1 Tax=unclassified Pseudarthrobacter TaxID=2647000 RepID=UPI00365FB2E0